MKKRWILAVMALTVLWGYALHRPRPEPQAVVHRICVRRDAEQVYCSDPQTMRQILNALRRPGQLLLTRQEPTVPPEVQLTLLLTDGDRRHYTFRGDRYLKKGDGPWQEAAPDHLAPLLELLSGLTTL